MGLHVAGRDGVPVLEYPFQFFQNKPAAEKISQGMEGEPEFDTVLQVSAVLWAAGEGVGVHPAIKGPLELPILKHTVVFITGMFGNPPHFCRQRPGFHFHLHTDALVDTGSFFNDQQAELTVLGGLGFEICTTIDNKEIGLTRLIIDRDDNAIIEWKVQF